MAARSAASEFVLLPMSGLRAETPALVGSVHSFLTSLHAAAVQPGATAFRLAGAARGGMRVLDEIAEDGAKLVELTPQALPVLRAAQPSVRVVPVVYYRPALARPPRPRPVARPAGLTAAGKVTVAVVSKADDTPVASALVVAFTKFAQRFGAQATTGKDGVATLNLAPARLQRLYVFPAHGFWSALRKNVAKAAALSAAVLPLDLATDDCLRHFYGQSGPTAGAGVTVGVIDTGVGPHPDLTVDGGANTITGEAETDFGDNGEHHGTHVAGIIAGRGTPPTGLRGLAPAVRLRSYRVFPAKGQTDLAPSFSIAKAIDRAAADGCDLINLSLTLELADGGPDPTVQDAIERAREGGAVVLAAAGNDGRAPVSFPASDALALAVSAMGRRRTFPAGTAEAADVAKPFGAAKANFVAAFSNVGPEIDLTGPGVGVVSAVPGGYAPLSGTSMACPAVTGCAARLLATQPTILAMTRDAARANAIAQLVLTAARPLGFGPTFEGQGMIP